MNLSPKLSSFVAGMFGRRPMAAISGAAALLALAPSAQAVVVVSPAANIAAPFTTIGVLVNVVTGASSTTSASAVPGWDLRFWGNSTTASALNTINAPSPTPSGTYVTYTNSGNVYLSNLAVGTEIGASSSYGSGLASTTVGDSAWVLNSTNYFGFRFINEADGRLYYGYGTMIIGSTLQDRTIGNLYYENVAGASITVAAASAVPEPASWAFMLGGLALAGTVARRRANRNDATPSSSQVRPAA